MGTVFLLGKKNPPESIGRERGAASAGDAAVGLWAVVVDDDLSEVKQVVDHVPDLFGVVAERVDELVDGRGLEPFERREKLLGHAGTPFRTKRK